jgi:hypothetical protein
MTDQMWFDETHAGLTKLCADNVFDVFDIVIQNYRIRIYTQKETGFSRFRRAFSTNQNPDLNIKPSLSLFCIDSKYIDALPLPPWKKKTFDSFGNAIGLGDQYHVRVNVESNQLQTIDISRGMALFYAENSYEMPSWEYFSPLKELLHFWCLSKALVLLHSAVIVDDVFGASLLLGKGGAGKSTTTIQAMDLNYQSCGDDYVIVSPSAMSVMPLYCIVKWQVSSKFVRPHYLDDCFEEWDDRTQKQVFFLNDDAGHSSTPKALEQILILDRTARYHPKSVSFHEALIQCTLSTITQVPVAAEKTFCLLHRLIQSCPPLSYGVGDGQEALIDALSKLRQFNRKECMA